MATDSSDTMIADCHLLKLPSELRNQIYEHVLVATHGIDANTWCRTRRIQNFYTSNTIKYAMEPALLATCKQIRGEGLPIFYGQNTFFAKRGNAAWWNFLMHIGPTKRAMVGNLKLFSVHNRVLTEEEAAEGSSLNGIAIPRKLLAAHLESVHSTLAKLGINFEDISFVFELQDLEERNGLYRMWRVDAEGGWMSVEYAAKAPANSDDGLGFKRWYRDVVQGSEVDD
jgi:hypothetical protein